jgi:hypothetical protein
MQQRRPEHHSLAGLARRRFSVCLIARPLAAIGGYAVPDSLPGRGLGHWRPAPELGLGDGVNVPHRVIIPPVRQLAQRFVRLGYDGHARSYRHQVFTGIHAVLANVREPLRSISAGAHPFLYARAMANQPAVLIVMFTGQVCG